MGPWGSEGKTRLLTKPCKGSLKGMTRIKEGGNDSFPGRIMEVTFQDNPDAQNVRNWETRR